MWDPLWETECPSVSQHQPPDDPWSSLTRPEGPENVPSHQAYGTPSLADGAETGSTLPKVTLIPNPHLLTVKPESCYGDSRESSKDLLTTPAMVSFCPVGNR